MGSILGISIESEYSLARYDIVTVESPEVDTQSSHVMTVSSFFHTHKLYWAVHRIFARA